MISRFRQLPMLLAMSLFVLPTSTNYAMHDFGFGSGGAGVSDSGNYSLSGVSGELSGAALTGNNFDLGPGLQFVRQTNVPSAPTFTNPANHYNKLKFVIDSGGNPSDTLFSIAISSDGFATTNYVQADQTVGSTPTFQTYADWGGASGLFVVGLSANTTYSLKVSAVQTKYTQSAYSAVSTAATVTPTLSYDIDIGATDLESSAPYVLQMGQLSVGSVTTAAEKIWIDLETNSESGAMVYLSSETAGLFSANTGSTLPAVSADLNSLATGFGVRADTTNQTTGSLTAVAPYAGANNVVGTVDTTTRTIFTTNSGPLSGGRASIPVKAKADTTTPAANDYSSVITAIATATF